MSYLQLILYKILDKLWLLIGQAVIAIFRKNQSRNITTFEEIIIYRADRLGDAIISLPFLKRFIAYARTQGYEKKIRIIASSYNYALLEPLKESDNVGVEIVETDAMQKYDRSILRTIWVFFEAVKPLFPRLYSAKRSNVAFIDLVDSVSEMALSNFSEYRDAYFCSANRGPFSIFFDSLAAHRFAWSSNANLVESYIDAFSQFFGFDGLRQFVYGNAETFYPDITDASKDILVFAWVKEIRNFPLSVWEDFINWLSKAFPDRKIVVSDMKNHAILEALEKKLWNDNVAFVRNTFSHAELQAFAARHSLVIGIDGGDINMMRPFTNSLTIFTFGNSKVWGPFLLGRPRLLVGLKNHWHLESTDIRPGRFAAMAYKTSFWLPSFQIPFDREVVADFDTEGIVEFIKTKISAS